MMRLGVGQCSHTEIFAAMALDRMMRLFKIPAYAGMTAIGAFVRRKENLMKFNRGGAWGACILLCLAALACGTADGKDDRKDSGKDDSAKKLTLEGSLPDRPRHGHTD